MEGIVDEFTDQRDTEEEKRKDDDVSGVDHQKKAWEPQFYCNINKEIHYYTGHEIKIYESLDSYGAIIWPAGVALCQYLDSNRKTINLQDKAVLELGAGTGLVSVVASLLGASVTASDLPEILGNLRCNLCRNTRGYCRYTPQVAVLSWGYDPEKTFPRSVYRYDYILAADVVYHHDFLDELLVTMRHFCQPGTTLIWANKIRFASDLVFTENFRKTFSTVLLADLGEIKIYSATAKEVVEAENYYPELLLEDGAKQEKESEECHFGNDSKKEDQHTDKEEVKDLNRGSEQRNVDKTEEAEDNCKDKHGEESHDLERNNKPAIFQRSCSPSMEHKQVKDVHNFLGHEICIENSSGDLTCAAAVALCKFLETPAGQEKIVLLDRTVVELHAGTGLLSVAATLLGAKVTATDRPESLENLRSNLHQNTRGRLRHKPQVTALTQDLEQNFPHSKCHFDYVLAAETLHHHDCFAELLVIMRHFFQPGTNLIWAIKVCYPSDLLYIKAFKKAFCSTVLAELDRVRIYLATHRAPDNEDDLVKTTSTEEEEMEKCPPAWNYTEDENPTREETHSSKDCGVDSDRNEGQCQASVPHNQKVETKQEEDTGGTDSEWEESWVSESESISTDESDETLSCQRIWESKFFYIPSKEIHYFMGHKIIIKESLDSYGAMIWPAAVALCKFLETAEGRQQIDLVDKTVLEIGAGTGLLSSVITLLGAKLTATDLPEILSNLQYNLNRNTRWLRRHEPQVKELSWGYELEKSFPRSLHHYDYVLAADVVYHHIFLDELLATMQHFCQPGTTLVWANKIRYPSDRTFLENFENIFHATLLAELDEIRIYSATYKCSSREKEERHE